MRIKSDSELLVKQMRGEYRVKNAGLQPLYQQARAMRRRLDRIVYEHVRREQNKDADRLANLAMDEGRKDWESIVSYWRRERSSAISGRRESTAYWPTDRCRNATACGI